VPGTDRPASSNDPDTWRSFETARADAERRGLALGFAITVDLDVTLIDIDRCISPDGTLTPEADALVAMLESHTERSISGTGLHILVQGTPPANASKPPGVEVYPGKRFVLLTGDILDGRDTIAERTAALALLFPSKPESARGATSAPLTLDDAAILDRARAAKNGAEFLALFDHGDTSPYGGDDSRADLALCSLLTFWTQNPEQVDRLFRQSALMRDKWERRPDYRKETISRGLARETFYTGEFGVVPPNRQDAASGIAADTDARIAHLVAMLAARDAELDRCCDDRAELRAELATVKAELAAVVQTATDTRRTPADRLAAISLARIAVKKTKDGTVEPDGRVRTSASETADDWRDKPRTGERLAPVNPRTGTKPLMPRSSAKSFLDRVATTGIVPVEKVPVIRTRGNGSTYPDHDYVLPPAATLAAVLTPFVLEPLAPKVRKLRESRRCPSCHQMHAVIRHDYCEGCGALVTEPTRIEPEPDDRHFDAPEEMGEFLSPLTYVQPQPALDVKGEKISPMISVPQEPDPVRDAPEPRSPEQAVVVMPWLPDFGNHPTPHHFSAD
jgi:hypothetical protein